MSLIKLVQGMDKEAAFELNKAWKIPQSIGEYFARRGSILGADVGELLKGNKIIRANRLKPQKRILSTGEQELLKEMKRLGYI